MASTGDEKLTRRRRGKRRRTSDAPVVVVPADIVFCILSRVPVRSLLRFRSVSKSWCALISDPSFRSGTRILILVGSELPDHRTCMSHDPSNGTLTTLFPSHDLDHCNRWLTPKFSCRGLICYDSLSKIFILNPVTRECVKSPKYNPRCACMYPLGFTYIASAGEYRILCKIAEVSQLSGPTHYAIFSFGGRVGMSWNVVKSMPPFQVDNRQAATVKGVVYMLRPLKENATREIVRFDMEREEWSVMLSPQVVEVRNLVIGLHELSGSLCYTCYSWKHRTCDMWILKDCDVWEKYEIDVNMFTKSIRVMTYDLPFRPLVIDNNGRLLFQVYFKDVPSKQVNRCKLVYYCPKSKKYEDVYRNDNPSTISFLPYEESLASPFVQASAT